MDKKRPDDKKKLSVESTKDFHWFLNSWVVKLGTGGFYDADIYADVVSSRPWKGRVAHTAQTVLELKATGSVLLEIFNYWRQEARFSLSLL